MFVVVFDPYGQTRLSKKCILAIRCARSPLVTDPVRRSGRPVAPRPVGAPGRGPASGAAARQLSCRCCAGRGGGGRLPRKRAPHRSPPWARGRRARVCDHPELGVDAPSAPACIRERSRALPVCEYLRQARQTTLGESGVAKLAECNLEVGQVQCTVFL